VIAQSFLFVSNKRFFFDLPVLMARKKRKERSLLDEKLEVVRSHVSLIPARQRNYIPQDFSGDDGDNDEGELNVQIPLPNEPVNQSETSANDTVSSGDSTSASSKRSSSHAKHLKKRRVVKNLARQRTVAPDPNESKSHIIEIKEQFPDEEKKQKTKPKKKRTVFEKVARFFNRGNASSSSSGSTSSTVSEL
jgi:hypothetical protein